MTEHRRRLAELLAGAEDPPRPSDEIGKLAGILTQRNDNRRNRADYHANRNTGPGYPEMWDAMHPMDKAALATAPVPGVGDIVGLAADARALYEEPSWANAGMMALGAVPLVPAAGVLKRGADAADAAGTMKAAKIAPQAETAQGPIRAYHGSPHDFDEFSLDAIGTGEGAQAYGHGLYFAESEDVARSYRDALSHKNRAIVVNGRTITPTGDLSPATHPEHRAAVIMRNALEDGSSHFAAKMRAQNFLSKAERGDVTLFQREGGWGDADALRETLRHIEEWEGKPVELVPDRMFEVNINANPDDFLDWDAPLREQSQRVQEALTGRLPPPGTNSYVDDTLLARPTKAGGYEYSANVGRFVQGTQGAEAGKMSNELREAGVPGIKYLDQGSRGAGEGSRNYVVFDANLIDIVRKYGIAGVMAMPVGAAMIKDYESRNGPLQDQL